MRGPGPTIQPTLYGWAGSEKDMHFDIEFFETLCISSNTMTRKLCLYHAYTKHMESEKFQTA